MSVYDFELERRIDELTKDKFWVTPNMKRAEKRLVLKEMDQMFHEDMCSATAHDPDCEYGISGLPFYGPFIGGERR